MAHKTLVNGTAYDITGGMTLVEGTSYSIKGGKTLIGGTEYDISFALPAGVLDLFGSSSSGSGINCITYADGYWVVGGRCYDGTNYYARIAYATSLDGTWTTRDLWSGTNSANTVNCIAYADGYWAVGGCRYYGNYLATVYYATSLDGTWEGRNLWSDTTYSQNSINCITCADGYWVVGGRHYDGRTGYARIAYGTSLGSWTTKNLWSSSGQNSINCITYANGYWVMGGMYYYSATYYAQIGYAESLSGLFSLGNVWSGGEMHAKITCITYANGYWVVGGVRYSSAAYHARIAYATTLSGVWTTVDLWNGGGGSDNQCVNGIMYVNGYWVLGGSHASGSTYYARIAYATSLDGTWTIVDVWSGGSDYLYCITNANGYWVVGGRHYDGSTCYARLAYAGRPEDLGNTE